MENLQTYVDFFEKWKFLPDYFRQTLTELVENADYVEMTDHMMVAPCPNCGSTKTRDLGNTAINDSTICVCLECGCIGCLTCGSVFNDGETACPHWGICDNCPEPKNDRGCCSIPLWKCSTIRKWKATRQYPFEF